MLTPLDLSATEKPRQIQENLMAYMRLFAGLPGVIVHDAESFWLVTHKPAPGDIILRTHFEGTDIEAQIDARLAEIGQHVDEIAWFVFPGDQPADLGKRLEARGMPGGKAGNWLWIDLTIPHFVPPLPNNFRIEQVRNDAMMWQWLKATEAGFGGEESIFYAAYVQHGYGADAFSLHYIGYLGDEAVTSGTLLDAGGGATVYDISTPPEFRGRGFGSALTHHMIEIIKQRGYADSWIWASDMAQSTYRKLGFVDADFGLREHMWRKS